MREVALETAGNDLARLLQGLGGDRVVLTRAGSPVAVVLGVENYDAEDMGYMTSPEFWKMIRERRQETEFVTLDEVKAKLLVDEALEAEAQKSHSTTAK